MARILSMAWKSIPLGNGYATKTDHTNVFLYFLFRLGYINCLLNDL